MLHRRIANPPHAQRDEALKRHCAGCAYDLRGLPSSGVCPECGRPYDAQTLVLFGWPGRSRNPVARNAEHAWRGMMVWGVLGVSICGALIFAERTDDALLMALIFGPIVAAYGALISNSADAPGPTQALITPDGIGQRDPFSGMRWWRWSPRHHLRILQDSPTQWRIAIQEYRLGLPWRSPVDLVVAARIEPQEVIEQIRCLQQAGISSQ